MMAWYNVILEYSHKRVGSDFYKLIRHINWRRYVECVPEQGAEENIFWVWEVEGKRWLEKITQD